jgi:predicted phosphodiesterase
MDNLNIQLKAGTKVTVFGDVHEHQAQFDELVERVKPSTENVLVSAGDLYDRGFGRQCAEYIADKIEELNKNGSAYIVQGNHELKNNRRGNVKSEWLIKQPLALSFIFANQTRLTIIHGGVRPIHTWEDLANNNTELAYVRYLDDNGTMITYDRKIVNGKKEYVLKRPGKPWHEYYDGRFGYIASGHEPQVDGIPKFFKYSCNLDTAAYSSGVLTAQVFSENGREELIQVTGPVTDKYKEELLSRKSK